VGFRVICQSLIVRAICPQTAANLAPVSPAAAGAEVLVRRHPCRRGPRDIHERILGPTQTGLAVTLPGGAKRELVSTAAGQCPLSRVACPALPFDEAANRSAAGRVCVPVPDGVEAWRC
jgi:hypothetical protein